MTNTRSTNLNLDDFPDSAYAAELRRGVSHWRFAPGIEEEYLSGHLDRVRLRVRVWYTLFLVIGCIAAAMQIHKDGLLAAGSLIQIAVLCPLTLILCCVVWTQHYFRYFVPLSRVAPSVLIALMTFVIAGHIATGNTEEVGALVGNVFALFLFSGLLFSSAVTAATLMLMAFFAGAIVFRMPPEIMVTGATALLITSGTAMVVCREMEVAHRRNFLEGVLIRELVARDGLTGIMNRRAFDEHLLRLWQQGKRDKRWVTLLMIDLDHFKALNDRHGHQSGDLALREVAQTIKHFARRPLDMAARYGGEEFIVILYDFAEPQIGVLAEQLRRAIEGLAIRHGAEMAGPVVTVSIGVGVVEPAINRTPQGAIQLADEALYEAKRLGRNRVVIHGSERYQDMRTGTFKQMRG